MPDSPDTETLDERKARIAMLRRLNSVLPKEKRHHIPPLYPPKPEDPASAEAVNALLALSRDAYATQICDHLGGEDDSRWILYLDPRLIHRTRVALARKHAAVTRMTNSTSDRTPAARRRRGFLDMLERRLQQVDAALPEAVLTSDRDTTQRLFAAIQIHRRATTANGVTPEPWDLALWAVADELANEDEVGSSGGNTSADL